MLKAVLFTLIKLCHFHPYRQQKLDNSFLYESVSFTSMSSAMRGLSYLAAQESKGCGGVHCLGESEVDSDFEMYRNGKSASKIPDSFCSFSMI